MSSTKYETATNVYAILVGGDVGAVASDEDISAINRYIDRAQSELEKRKAVYISDTDNLDDEIFSVFCQFVANDAANEFGGVSDLKKKQELILDIRRIVAASPAGNQQQTEFF